MKPFKKILILIFLVFTNPNLLKAEHKLKFANLDLIINKTNIGIQMLDRINKLDNDNIDQLNIFENEIRNLEDEIKLKK
uniref:hypothetical protein n=1 Tax=Candidatus Pelagibacter sp. TaxID=2024849 RepID=UPI003F864C94